MPNATLSHIASLTPDALNGFKIEIEYIDEYVRTSLDYLERLKRRPGVTSLIAIVGVQSHQFHRAIDLAAFARVHGAENVVIGGPHVLTCDTSLLHGRGVSFSLAEAELVWAEILEDAISGGLNDVYGIINRWAPEILEAKFRPPPLSEVSRHWVPMVGYYPVRGCPFTCSFCSVIKIAGRQVRNPPISSIISALQEIEKIGVEFVVFTSDNFNKFPAVKEMLNKMIEHQINVRFWFQADTQIAKQESLVELIGRAGGTEMFVGAESFDNHSLNEVGKRHNKPDTYYEIVRMCRENGIRAHFSNIFGFPDQNEKHVHEHMQHLINLSPEFASFYVLTPIPGTEQYREYLEQDLIYEKNLDRFDAHTPTFEHNHFSPEKLQELVFSAYEEFYKHSMNAHKENIDRETRNYMVFCRWSASKKIHPMSSGIGSVELDRNEDYFQYRVSIFDVGPLLPLPKNLVLSEADEALNRAADWRSLEFA